MVVPLNSNTLGDEEIAAAKAILDSGHLTMGKQCAAFEAAVASYVGSRNAIMVNSGSSANLIAAFVLADAMLPGQDNRRRIEPGSEVIIPALTWSTTAWPFVQAGATPVFVDCDPVTLQVAPETIEAAITNKTRAIVIVHIFGGAVDAPAVREIADHYNLWLVEDTCESLGVRWKGRLVGGLPPWSDPVRLHDRISNDDTGVQTALGDRRISDRRASARRRRNPGSQRSDRNPFHQSVLARTRDERALGS